MEWSSEERAHTVRALHHSITPPLLHFPSIAVALDGADDVAERVLELAFGVADVRRGDAGRTVGDEAAEAAGAGQGIVQLGVDEVLDCLTQRFGLVCSHHYFTPGVVATR